MRALDRHHRVTVVPFQEAGAPAAHGLTRAECEAAAWAVTPDRRRYPAAAAINLTVAVALGTGLPLWLYVLPGIRQLQERAYGWVAANRSRLPGDRPHCEQYPEGCED